MARRSGLDRGLGYVLSGRETSQAGAIQEIPVDRIFPNPHQPRRRIDTGELAELEASIREYGVLQPLIVTYEAGAVEDEPEHYTLIAGHRRLLASRQAGLKSVPAIIREASEQQRLLLAVIENVQRTDLSPLDQAEAYRQLADDYGLTHDEISTRVGKSREMVTNTLRLLKLPEVVQKALVEGKITQGHCNALLSLANAHAQSAALHTVIQYELSVRKTEELVRRLKGERPEPKKPPASPPEISDLENRLRDRLGTRVTLNRRGKGGTLVIHFFSDEELNSLIQEILGGE